MAENDTQKKLLFFVGFFSLSLAIYFSYPSDLIAKFMRVRAEYTVYEQLQKIYLLALLLMAVYSYISTKELIKIKSSICYIILGIVLYLSESNMITEKIQPIFGILIIPLTFGVLFAKRAWLSVLLLGLGFFVIFFGFITDLLTAYAGFAALLPLFLKSFLQSHIHYEEYYDTIGLGLVCLSAIYHFYDEIGPLVRKNILSFMFVFVSISLIGIGNGFAHWQYNPGAKLTLIPLLITLIGLSGFVIINEKILVNRFRIKVSLINRGPYYLFLYSIFVMLPTVCGRIYDIACLVLWLPLLLALTLYLYYRRIIKIDAKD